MSCSTQWQVQIYLKPSYLSRFRATLGTSHHHHLVPESLHDPTIGTTGLSAPSNGGPCGMVCPWHHSSLASIVPLCVLCLECSSETPLSPHSGLYSVVTYSGGTLIQTLGSPPHSPHTHVLCISMTHLICCLPPPTWSGSSMRVGIVVCLGQDFGHCLPQQALHLQASAPTSWVAGWLKECCNK